MASCALQRLEAGLIVTTPITQAVYDAALALQAQSQPVAVEVAAPVVQASEPTVRALVDIPVFMDHEGRSVRLKAGDVATVSNGIADLLVRRGKAQLVEATA